MRARRATRIIVLIEPSGEHERRILRGFCRVAALQDPPWSVRWGFTGYSTSPTLGREFDAAVALPDGNEMLASLKRRLPRTINVGTRVTPLAEPSAVPDNLAIGQMAAHHLINRWHRSFAFVGVSSHPYSEARFQGFRAELGSTPLRSFDLGADHGRQTPLQALRRFVAALPRDTALFAANDIFAKHVAVAAVEVGRLIPEELAVLGVDHDDMLSLSSPVRLSSVDPDSERVGVESALLLQEWLRTGRRPRRIVRVPPRGVSEQASTDRFVTEDPMLARAMQQIRQRAAQGLTIDDLAEQLGLGRRTLERRFHAAFGRGVDAQIREERIRRACELLLEPGIPIKEVAERAGFSDLFYFSAAFKRARGESPSDYRTRFLRPIA